MPGDKWPKLIVERMTAVNVQYILLDALRLCENTEGIFYRN